MHWTNWVHHKQWPGESFTRLRNVLWVIESVKSVINIGNINQHPFVILCEPVRWAWPLGRWVGWTIILLHCCLPGVRACSQERAGEASSAFNGSVLLGSAYFHKITKRMDHHTSPLLPPRGESLTLPYLSGKASSALNGSVLYSLGPLFF